MILLFLQDFFSRETNFHFCQFLSNFFKYSFSNFPLFHPNNNFTVYFSGNSLILNSLTLGFNFTFYIFSNLSYYLTSILTLLLNSFTTSFTFSKFSSFFYVLFFTINLFYYTKYFITSQNFLLFNIFSTSHSSTLSISTSFNSFTLCSFTSSLYLTTLLMFTTR